MSGQQVKKQATKRFGRGVHTKLTKITLPTMELSRTFGERGNPFMNDDSPSIERIREQRRRRIAQKLQEQDLKIMQLEGEKEVRVLEKEVEKLKPKNPGGESCPTCGVVPGEAETAATLTEEAKLPPAEAAQMARNKAGVVVVKAGEVDGKKTKEEVTNAMTKGMEIAVDAMKTGANMKGNSGSGEKGLSLSDTKEFVGTIVEAKLAKLDAKLEAALAKGNTGQSRSIAKEIKELQDIGIPVNFGGAQGLSAEQMRAMNEKDSLNKEFLIRLKQMDRDENYRFAELGEKRRRNDILASGFKRIGRAVARGLSEGGEEEEEEPEKGGQRKPSRKKVKVYRCSECAAKISVPPGLKPGDAVKCAKCGAEYVAKDTAAKENAKEDKEATVRYT